MPRLIHSPDYFDDGFLDQSPPYFDLNNPGSVGRYLDRIAKTNDLLAKRLAPKRLMQLVRFVNVAPGTQGSGVGNSGSATNGLIVMEASNNTSGTFQIRDGWNGMIVSVATGQINWAFGSIGSNQGTISIPFDMFAGPTVVPIYIPLPPQEDSNNKISFWADSGATQNTVGTVWFVNY
jgi:hypothetical protein